MLIQTDCLNLIMSPCFRQGGELMIISARWANYGWATFFIYKKFIIRRAFLPVERCVLK